MKNQTIIHLTVINWYFADTEFVIIMKNVTNYVMIKTNHRF